jgi:hypothetical protein
MTYGTNLPPSIWAPLRSVVASPELSGAGNVILRVGREVGSPDDPDVQARLRAEGTGMLSRGWQQSEHVVLTPSEHINFVLELIALLPDKSVLAVALDLADHDA